MVGDVERMTARLAARLDDALGHGMGGIEVDVGHDHLGAGLGEAMRDGGAIAAAGAGDQRQASGEQVFQHAALIAGSAPLQWRS